MPYIANKDVAKPPVIHDTTCPDAQERQKKAGMVGGVLNMLPMQKPWIGRGEVKGRANHKIARIVILCTEPERRFQFTCVTLRHMMFEKGGQSEWAENRKDQWYESASQAKKGCVFLLISTTHGRPTSYGEVSLVFCAFREAAFQVTVL